MGFATAWQSQLLTSLADTLSPEQKRAIFGACSKDCTAPWAAKAVEIRHQLPADADIAALLAAFCAVLPGGGPDVVVDGSHISWSFAPAECPCPVGQATKPKPR
ncbi:MAG: hypothetical protein ACYC5O_13240 [Anaerolineae bacterium]